LLEKDDSLTILKPLLPGISQAISEAITEFNRDPLKIFYSNRTRASAINDLIVSKALMKFFNTKEIRIKQSRGCTYFFIKDKFLLRFKKFNRNLRTNNIPTHQSNKFLHQQTLFDELPTPTNLFAGYTWDNLTGNYSDIYLTCPTGSTNEWSHWLVSEGAEIIPLTLKLPTPPDSPKKRVRAKGLKENAGNTEK
jgi:hypothetical protein